MPTAIQIRVGDIALEAELNDSDTAARMLKVLPVQSRFHIWGDEIYFATSVAVGPEDPQETVALGDLAYWPPGKAFCIFYGPTPGSKGDEIRPASPVNPIGRVLGDATALKQANPSAEIVIEQKKDS